MSVTQLELEGNHPPHEPVARLALGTVLGAVRLALADRVLVWVALAAGIGFTGWALARPDVLRLVGVAGYVLLIFWPLLFVQHQRRN